MAGIDLNRTSAGVADLLPSEISQEIWSNTIENSVFMQAARQISIPASGVTIPIITGDAQAEWVDETDEKPVSNATVSSKSLKPYKAAVIEPFSDEFRRDLPGLYAELARRLPLSLGVLFDQTILGSTSPGSGFDVLGGADAIAVGGADVVDDLASVLSAVNTEGGDLSHWLVSPQLEGTLITAKDPGTGSYAFLRDARTDSGAIGSIFGRDVLKSKAVYDGTATPAVTGIAGDFSRAMWGSVEGIKVSLSNEASVVRPDGTVLHLWQRNMFGLRVEFEVGFAVEDEKYFRRITADAEGNG